jgi:GTP-binding protein Era
MVQLAVETLEEVDVILLVVNPFPKDLKEARHIIDVYLSKVKKPCFLLINKVDKIAKTDLLPIIDGFSKVYNFEAIIPLSAKKEIGLLDTLKKILVCLPQGPKYYDEDLITDQTERQIAAETIREKIVNSTREEVPYCVAVSVEEFEEWTQKQMFYISAIIYVERDSQKGIIIGKKGQKLKSIGQAARKELEFIFGKRLFLRLFVRVQPKWRHDPKVWRKLGLK